jgi:hypothetical protein
VNVLGFSRQVRVGLGTVSDELSGGGTLQVGERAEPGGPNAQPAVASPPPRPGFRGRLRCVADCGWQVGGVG